MIQFNKKRLFLTLTSLLLIALVSVPSVLAYFSTYTGTEGTKVLNFKYESHLEEEIDDTDKIIKITSEKESEPIYVRVRYFAADSKMTVTPDDSTLVVDGKEVWKKGTGTDEYFYYLEPISNGDSTSSLKLLVTSKEGANFPVGDLEHVIVIYEAVPVRYDANNQPYADWTQQLHTTTEIIEHETTAVEGGGE